MCCSVKDKSLDSGEEEALIGYLVKEGKYALGSIEYVGFDLIFLISKLLKRQQQ